MNSCHIGSCSHYTTSQNSLTVGRKVEETILVVVPDVRQETCCGAEATSKDGVWLAPHYAPWGRTEPDLSRDEQQNS